MSEITKEETSKDDGDDIKSQAIIKFQSVPELTFSQLDLLLDLRLPPSNWLNGAIKMTNYKSTFNFSSFKMAFDFYEELASSEEIDVIASSEVIKKLLMVAFNEQSMMSYFVHRVGNTLLIDEFNLHRYLLWKSEEEDWKWLRNFIGEHVLNTLSKEKTIPIEHKKTKEFLEQKNLLSKFLYYSIEEDSKKVEEPKEYMPSYLENFNVVLPLPKREDMEILSDDSNQLRTIMWKLEDIRMMIGSDMQIFGNDTRPCISLRLRDMKDKINVLTGIDYWLDNLMCNVPEIFMCYHLDGIVQKYELIKTEELPNLSESKFSPKIIKNVAQNILSFLKGSATKPGHTYWLFKSKNDDYAKLYDLTTLQLLTEEKETSKGKEEEKKNENCNPFTYPVGVLLYTLARNMKYSKEKFTAKKAGNIKVLLDNCLKLLPIEKYPQIIATSHYILADIQIQAGLDPTNPESPFFESSDNSSDENSDDFNDESEDEAEECLPAVQSIRDTMKEYRGCNRKSNRTSPLVLGDICERSVESLKNIIAGLRALDYLMSDDNVSRQKQIQKDQIIHEEQNPNVLHDPEVAIPMGWINLKQDDASDNVSTTSRGSFQNLDSKSLLMRGNPNVKTWNTHLKTLLFEKASLTYACLAESSYNKGNYGATLKNIQLSLMCQAVIKKFIPSINTQTGVFYGRAGDCYFQIAKSLDKIQKYVHGFDEENDLDRDLLKQLEKEELGEVESEIVMPFDDEEKMLKLSCDCYEFSLIDTNQSKVEIVRRLGNVYNEIGVKLMHKSQQAYNAFIEDFNKKSEEEKARNENDTSYQQIAKQSYDYIMKGVVLFESATDHVNLVICYLNLGRFYRLSAHINIFHDYNIGKTLKMQKKFYQQSFDSYCKALDILVEKKMKGIDLYDIVLWEYSTAVFNLAREMQDGMAVELSKEEAEREVLEMLMKALQLCDLDTNNSRQVLYMFRAGLIHQKVASLHHQSLRMLSDEYKRKSFLQLCRLHYEKSAKLLESLKEHKEFLKVQMERIALQEFLAEEASGNQKKIKCFHFALSYFTESRKIIKLLEDVKSLADSDEVLQLLELFEKRLQFALKSLTKLSTAGKKLTEAENYKKMFACTLRNAQQLKLKELARHLSKVLEAVHDLMESK